MMMNVNNIDRQNLLVNLINQHKELIMLMDDYKKYSAEARYQFKVLDNLTTEMLKANSKELGLYKDPET